jgi:hypothetical protein
MANITSASITLRSSKGSPLTNTEVDNNFSNINTALATGLTAASYTAADVLSKLNSVSGPTQAGGVNADTVTFASGARSATNLATGNTIVARDSSGNFSATTITANLTGTASVASSLNYTVAISGGGTGATDAGTARTNLGLAIGSNVQAYSGTLAALAGTTTAADVAPYYTGAGTASTHSFTSFMRGVAGSADAPTARSNLGLVIGTNVQAYDATLTSLAGSGGGILVKTGTGTTAPRSLAAGTGITISNADGTGGNPTISVTSYVSSVQGNTGAVIVSVPVTSVQGATGAVIVTNISGSAGYATSAGSASSASYASIAGSAQGGWPYFLSQYGNNLGNYGGWQDSTALNNCSNNCGGAVYKYSVKQGFQASAIQQQNCQCNC